MIIPHERLSKDTLRHLIEEYVTRGGTDTGYTRNTLSQNVDQVKQQLERGRVCVVFDEKTESCNIVAKTDLPREERL